MNLENVNRNILAIEYPGIVKNVDYMIKTLGGLNNISKVANNVDKKRLDLKFRPENIFSKPIFGDLHQTTGILMKVKRKRRKNAPKDQEDVQEPQIEVLGTVKQIIKFDGICDYQYLPLAKDPTTEETKFIYDDIVPTSMVDSDWLTDDSEEVSNIPYFLPPSLFTRVDTCQDGLFKKDRSNETAEVNSPESSVVRHSRQRRFKFASYISFSLTKPIPEKPQVQALRLLKYNFVTNEQFNLVKEYLDRQPIWLRSALGYETKIPRQKLKVILPSLAYYYTNGPWRLMWVRYGYDPRKDFSSRYFQTLDYRIRANSLKERIARARKRRSQNETEEEQSNGHNYPYFEVDKLPQARQAFYRYCDVHVPKIQEMLDKIPSPLSGATCNEKTGWLPPNFDDTAREILSETILKQMSAEGNDEEEESIAESAGIENVGKEEFENDDELDRDDDDDEGDEDDIEGEENEDDIIYEDEQIDVSLSEE